VTARVVYPLLRVLGIMTKAQLMGEGSNPVKVQYTDKDGTTHELLVQSARFDQNSGNVILKVQE